MYVGRCIHYNVPYYSYFRDLTDVSDSSSITDDTWLPNECSSSDDEISSGDDEISTSVPEMSTMVPLVSETLWKCRRFVALLKRSTVLKELFDSLQYAECINCNTIMQRLFKERGPRSYAEAGCSNTVELDVPDVAVLCGKPPGTYYSYDHATFAQVVHFKRVDHFWITAEHGQNACMMLSHKNWKVITCLTEVLRPFAKATTFLSGGSYRTLPMAFLVSYCNINRLSSFMYLS